LVHTTDGNVVGEWGVRKWWIEKTKTKNDPISILQDNLTDGIIKSIG
jgi:hypothetical protein